LGIHVLSRIRTSTSSAAAAAGKSERVLQLDRAARERGVSFGSDSRLRAREFKGKNGRWPGERLNKGAKGDPAASLLVEV